MDDPTVTKKGGKLRFAKNCTSTKPQFSCGKGVLLPAADRFIGWNEIVGICHFL
jgi:hypothetical protein